MSVAGTNYVLGERVRVNMLLPPPTVYKRKGSGPVVGQVAFIGKIPLGYSKEMRIGVAFEEPIGNCAGDTGGTFYFECGENCGTFVRPNAVKSVDRRPRDSIRPTLFTTGGDSRSSDGGSSRPPRTSLLPSRQKRPGGQSPKEKASPSPRRRSEKRTLVSPSREVELEEIKQRRRRECSYCDAAQQAGYSGCIAHACGSCDAAKTAGYAGCVKHAPPEVHEPSEEKPDPYAEDLRGLREEVAALRSARADAAGDVDFLVKDEASLRESVQVLMDDRLSMRAAVSAARGDADGLRSEVDMLKHEVVHLRKQQEDVLAVAAAPVDKGKEEAVESSAPAEATAARAESPPAAEVEPKEIGDGDDFNFTHPCGMTFAFKGNQIGAHFFCHGCSEVFQLEKPLHRGDELFTFVHSCGQPFLPFKVNQVGSEFACPGCHTNFVLPPPSPEAMIEAKEERGEEDGQGQHKVGEDKANGDPATPEAACAAGAGSAEGEDEEGDEEEDVADMISEKSKLSVVDGVTYMVVRSCAYSHSAKTGEMLKAYKGFPCNITSMFVDLKQQRVYVVGDKSTLICTFGVKTGRMVGRFGMLSGHLSKGIAAVYVTRKAKCYSAGLNDGEIIVWTPQSRKSNKPKDLLYLSQHAGAGAVNVAENRSDDPLLRGRDVDSKTIPTKDKGRKKPGVMSMLVIEPDAIEYNNFARGKLPWRQKFLLGPNVIYAGYTDGSIKKWYDHTELALSPVGSARVGHCSTPEWASVPNGTASTHGVTQLCYDDVSNSLFSAGRDGSIRQRNADSGLIARVLQHHTGPVTGLCYDEGAHMLLSVSRDKQLAAWDNSEGIGAGTLAESAAQQVSCTFAVPVESEAQSVFVNSRKKLVYVGCKNGAIASIDLSLRARALKSFKPAASDDSSFEESSDSEVPPEDHNLKLEEAVCLDRYMKWSASMLEAHETHTVPEPFALVAEKTQSRINELESAEKENFKNRNKAKTSKEKVERMGGVVSLCLDPDATANLYAMRVTSTKDVSVELYEGRQGARIIDGHPAWAEAVEYHEIEAEGQGDALGLKKGLCTVQSGQDPLRLLFSGGEDNTIRQWNAKTGELMRMFEGHTDDIRRIKVSSKCSSMFTSSRDRTIRKWDLMSGELQHVFEGHTGTVENIVLREEGHGGSVYSIAFDGTIRKWDIETGRELHCWKTGTDTLLIDIAMSGDGKHGYVTSVDDMAIYRVNTAGECPPGACQCQVDKTYTPSSEDDAGEPEKLALCNDDSRMVAALGSKMLMWDVNKEKSIATFKGHADNIIDFVIDEDGGMMYTCSDDKTLRKWNMKTQECLQVFWGHIDCVAVLALDVQHKRLYSASDDATVREWTLNGKNTFIVNTHDEAVGSILLLKDHDELISISSDIAVTKLALMRNLGCNCTRVFDQSNAPEHKLKKIRDTRHWTWKKGPEKHFAVTHDMLPFEENFSHKFKRMVHTFMPVFAMLVAALLLLIELFQLITFAFQQSQWVELDEPKEETKQTQTLGLDSYTFSLGVAATVILILNILFPIQETLEERQFRNPTSVILPTLWSFVQFASKLLTQSFFVPIMTILLSTYNCETPEGSDTSRLASDMNIECWRGRHLFYVVFCIVLALIYGPLCLRMMLMGGEIVNLEVKKNPLNWKSDAYPVVRMREHVFSYGLEGITYLVVGFLVKVLLVVSSQFLEYDLLALGIYNIVVYFIMTVVTLLYPPYCSDGGNKLRAGLSMATLWTFISPTALKDAKEVGFILMLSLMVVFFGIGFVAMSVVLSKRRSTLVKRLQSGEFDEEDEDEDEGDDSGDNKTPGGTAAADGTPPATPGAVPGDPASPDTGAGVSPPASGAAVPSGPPASGAHPQASDQSTTTIGQQSPGPSVVASQPAPALLIN